MQTKDYLKLVEENCIEPILEFSNAKKVDLEVIQVWYCKTVQNHKGLFIIKNIKDNFIYDYFIEATYNGDKQELYLDFYTKQFKQTINCKGE